jgi:hypothetical protein
LVCKQHARFGTGHHLYVEEAKVFKVC